MAIAARRDRCRRRLGPRRQEITEFSVGSSNSAGRSATPTSRAASSSPIPDSPRSPRTSTVNLPAGIFGNPGAIFSCRAADFVVNHCAPGSQVGLITIFANYEGTRTSLLGTAPLYNMETVGEDEAARLAFVAPTVNVPIDRPDHRSQRLRLRPAHDRLAITQTIALSSASHDDLGLPRATGTRRRTVPPGIPGRTPRLPRRSRRPNASKRPSRTRGETVRPFIDNPSICTGRAAAGRRSTSPPTRTRHLRQRRVELPGDDRLRKPEIRPGLQPRR